MSVAITSYQLPSENLPFMLAENFLKTISLFLQISVLYVSQKDHVESDLPHLLNTSFGRQIKSTNQPLFLNVAVQIFP